MIVDLILSPSGKHPEVGDIYIGDINNTATGIFEVVVRDDEGLGAFPLGFLDRKKPWKQSFHRCSRTTLPEWIMPVAKIKEGDCPTTQSDLKASAS